MTTGHVNPGAYTPEGTPNPEAPNPQLPIVQKVRIRYAKRDRLRFTSHRDFSRAFERAVRRAGIPIGFSSGFHPHPKISYANAAPTGSASEAEYLEIGLTRPVDVAEIRAALDAALPPGLDIVDAVVAGQGALADRLQGSEWSLRLPGTTPGHVQTAVDAFLAAETIPVERMTKRGLRTMDARGAVVALSVTGVEDSAPEFEGPCAILTLVVRHDTPSVRPDDVLTGLRSVGLVPEQTHIATRSAQGPLDPESGTVGDPLALDRDAP